jgi:ADP-ribose pyrophosphatase YjhB (NUDIX family)
MNFCMKCGQPLLRKWLDIEARERNVCSACHTVHYNNPKLLVWCFAYWQQKIVLCRRAHEPARNLWNPPSGFVEAHESLEQAIAREMQEEAGLVVPLAQLMLYRVSSIPHMNEVYVGFRAELSAAPLLVAGPEVSELGLYGEGDAPLHNLAFAEMLGGVPQDFFAYMRTGIFPVVAETIKPGGGG